MLDGGADALALHALDIGHGGPRRQERFFSIVFEVSAAHGSAIYVDARAQHEVHATGASILSDYGSDSLGKFRIPRGGEANAAEHGGGSVVPNSDWPVGHSQPRQANLLVRSDVEIVDPADEIDLFF